MSGPLVSVIIPTYRGAECLGRAIRSVLDQTCSNLELVVVDDASPDHTSEVVRQFDDPRLAYVRHESNRGAATARSTGARCSSGDIVAFLDQDDLFHPEKVQVHVEYLGRHPDVGFTYNPYFDLLPSSDAVRTVFQPPERVSLADLTVGFYLPPSSWVMRRAWALHDEIRDVQLSLRGREIFVCSRLFMAGCRFARIDRVLHSRGYHAGRRIGSLEKNWQEELACQELIFSDPRCPPAVLSTRGRARMVITLMWANVALAQGETALARRLLSEVARVSPACFEGRPSFFLSFLVGYCADDESEDYAALLDRIWPQLPPEVPETLSGYLWARPRGHLLRGVRALIWGRLEEARHHLARAAEFGVTIDEEFVQQVTHELRGYELHCGADAARAMLATVGSGLAPYIGRRSAGWIEVGYLADRALHRHRAGSRDRVTADLVRAVTHHPRYLLNRGVASVLVKSLFGVGPGPAKA